MFPSVGLIGCDNRCVRVVTVYPMFMLVPDHQVLACSGTWLLKHGEDVLVLERDQGVLICCPGCSLLTRVPGVESTTV